MGDKRPFYRYTMPGVQIKVEGTSKMIKTIIVNIEDVCAALGRPVDYLVTYLGQEMSANSKNDKATGKCYVTGKMEQPALQEAVFKFINNHVMCGKCHNPETVVTTAGKKKNIDVILSCKGCGGKTTLDRTDRFVKYQAAHPPELDPNAMDHKKLMEKKPKAIGKLDEEDPDADDGGKKKKKKKKKGEGEDDEDGAGGEDGEKKKKKKKKKKGEGEDDDDGPMSPDGAGGDDGEKKKKKKKKKVVEEVDEEEEEEDDDDDEDWCMDVSEEAVAARAAAANVDKMLAAAEAAEAAAEKAAAAAAEEELIARTDVVKVTEIEVADDEVDDIDDI